MRGINWRMAKRSIIKVVDLFSGPGGLGEGFSSFSTGAAGHHPFRIGASAEMDPAASRTLCLRSFFRKTTQNRKVPQSYYDYIAGKCAQPFDSKTSRFWNEAVEETRPVTLGSKEGDEEIDLRLRRMNLSPETPSVLIGGPPCQAYSLVGRARNRGIAKYVPEDDKRHFLYQDYLRILAEHKPAVFVMENVKGILSSKVAGEKVFHKILEDLAAPELALREGARQTSVKYRLYSLLTGDHFEKGDDPAEFDSRRFIVKAEDHGIPQRRHRVFILGVREDIEIVPERLKPGQILTCGDVIDDLPALRSGLSKMDDNTENWLGTVQKEGQALVKNIKNSDLSEVADSIANTLVGMNRKNILLQRNMGDQTKLLLKALGYGKGMPDELTKWFLDSRLAAISNHETRGHIAGDLGRYLFCSSFGKVYGGTPKAREFPDCLAPLHANWNSGKFADRFRVQLSNQPATTITSHISKDGHYFIHPDPGQCRSLTVREAARIQTFPDNYYFEGNRTQQYGQVGNAVPPLLARQIAKIVFGILN